MPTPNKNGLERYAAMLRIRRVEETIAERYVEQEMRCPVHLSIGQEAAAVGACAPLTSRDVIVSNHRSHSHYLAKGGDLNAMIAEIYGRSNGCCGGRGGSMHLFDNAAGVLASVPIVASTIPLAVGAAMAFQQRSENSVSVAFLGDGATEEGVFHESLNLASLYQLPVVFFVENNLYSVYTPLRERQPDRDLADYGLAHSLPSETVDGNDVDLVMAAMETAVNRARAGNGPTLLVVSTYRWREHCGPNFDNDLGYRTEEEFFRWRERCPIDLYRSRMMQAEVLNDSDARALEEKIHIEIEEAFNLAKSSPFPDPATVAERVYA
jgi:TPP-dependent pyruvate/acetoin dehydrogenase alpha subunit